MEIGFKSILAGDISKMEESKLFNLFPPVIQMLSPFNLLKNMLYNNKAMLVFNTLKTRQTESHVEHSIPLEVISQMRKNYSTTAF